MTDDPCVDPDTMQVKASRRQKGENDRRPEWFLNERDLAVVPEAIPWEIPEVILVLIFLLQEAFLVLPIFTYMI